MAGGDHRPLPLPKARPLRARAHDVSRTLLLVVTVVVVCLVGGALAARGLVRVRSDQGHDAARGSNEPQHGGSAGIGHHEQRDGDDGGRSKPSAPPQPSAAFGVVWEPCRCTDQTTPDSEREQFDCPLAAPTAGGERAKLTSRKDVTGQLTVSIRSQKVEAPDGLVTRRGYISEHEESDLIKELESHPFGEYYGKAAQEFGMNFSFYNPKPTDAKMPKLLQQLADRMVHDGLLDPPPNYVLVNKYRPGEGIHPHVDDAYYSGTITSITLGAPGVLYFSLDKYANYYRREAPEGLIGKRTADGAWGSCRAAYFPRRSMFVMKDEARYGWRHEMPRRLLDSIPFANLTIDELNGRDGIAVPGQPIRTLLKRQTRYSLTYRYVRPEVVAARSAGQRVSNTAYKPPNVKK